MSRGIAPTPSGPEACDSIEVQAQVERWLLTEGRSWSWVCSCPNGGSRRQFGTATEALWDAASFHHVLESQLSRCSSCNRYWSGVPRVCPHCHAGLRCYDPAGIPT